MCGRFTRRWASRWRIAGRPIVYSLCEYGMGNVGTWGTNAGANLWRTTGDIQDNWRSMSGIGFNQGRQARYAGPGHWNDPDMLEVGNGGMSRHRVQNRTSVYGACWRLRSWLATTSEACRSRRREILTNREVIAVDQDVLGKEGDRIIEAGTASRCGQSRCTMEAGRWAFLIAPKNARHRQGFLG